MLQSDFLVSVSPSHPYNNRERCATEPGGWGRRCWATDKTAASRRPEPQDGRAAWGTGVLLVLQGARPPSACVVRLPAVRHSCARRGQRLVRHPHLLGASGRAGQARGPAPGLPAAKPALPPARRATPRPTALDIVSCPVQTAGGARLATGAVLTAESLSACPACVPRAGPPGKVPAHTPGMAPAADHASQGLGQASRSDAGEGSPSFTASGPRRLLHWTKAAGGLGTQEAGGQEGGQCDPKI